MSINCFAWANTASKSAGAAAIRKPYAVVPFTTTKTAARRSVVPSCPVKSKRRAGIPAIVVCWMPPSTS
ncbi:MAG: hypothetical protein LC793_20470 [Thermomicrobia bacterium]|nr:hypothetical protein [Thermomicrobia bacterium]